MSSAETPEFTHYRMEPQYELPPEYYWAIGRALYRWSQVEGTIAALAVSIHSPIWMEALNQLRPRGRFNLTELLRRLTIAAEAVDGGEATVRHIESAKELFIARKELFHSIWGRVAGPNGASVGIQEWSLEDHANFRAVSLDELMAFSAKCAEVAQGLMKDGIPLFHGTASFVIDDEDGLTKPFDSESGDHSSGS